MAQNVYPRKFVFGVWRSNGSVCIAGESSIGSLEEILCERIIDGKDININGSGYYLLEKRRTGRVDILTYAPEREIWP